MHGFRSFRGRRRQAGCVRSPPPRVTSSKPMRTGDPRHTLSSRALAHGQGRSIIGRQLGHGRAETAAPCAHQGNEVPLCSGRWLTVSRRRLPALKEGVVEAAMAMLSPVRGLRP